MALVANLLGFHDVHGDSCDYCQKGFGAVRIIILDGQRNWGAWFDRMIKHKQVMRVLIYGLGRTKAVLPRAEKAKK